MAKKGLVMLVSMIILIVLMTLTATALNSQPYHLKLLAVQETDTGYEGSDADLYLEIRTGSGRVFLDTYPLTKMDTQSSTRFAKEIACKHFKLDCEQYDFIYTIKAKSSIVGGPSAGAAMSALTAIAVLNLPYDNKVTITGTINSGGIIGPVGGTKEKIEAASKAGLKKVLVAKGSGKLDWEELALDKAMKSQNKTDEIDDTNETNSSVQDNPQNITIPGSINNTLINETFDLISYSAKNLSLEVVEVTTLEEVIFQLTGVELNHKEITFEEDIKYKEIMEGLKNILCGRLEEIKKEIKERKVAVNESLFNEIIIKQGRAENATKKGDFYSAASYCFGANVDLKKAYYGAEKLNKEALAGLFVILDKKVQAFEKNLAEEKIETISDLQAAMVVRERLNDVKLQLKKFTVNKDKISVDEADELLAYAEERYFSAISWNEFFAMDGKKFVFDTENLKNSCQQKISEAEERFQYISFFLLPVHLLHINEKIELAREALQANASTLCLSEAAQAKAEADAILSTLGVKEENLPDFFESKRKAVERIIAENTQEGIFPILGYSYYQYARSLQESDKDDKYAALLYLEYALEMSDLGIYFPEEQTVWENSKSWYYQNRTIFVMLESFLLGVLVTLLIVWIWWTRSKQSYQQKLKVSKWEKL